VLQLWYQSRVNNSSALLLFRRRRRKRNKRLCQYWLEAKPLVIRTQEQNFITIPKSPLSGGRNPDK
jgi:hypothetical protein